ncbi:polysaccharide deacetylase family protein [Mucilaginibacter sp. UYCu711]|uniref:polysaccharide deacetylase family protein n=1 Tax=Mucilaginibacter sp. UYCu711 TaxID=3156339 RepID=UPI003D210DD7
MFSIDSFNGSRLDDHTLCITFDDGPGEHSESIGKYLFEENITATFFVVGKYAYEYPEVLQALKNFGHIIANHTYDHPDMTYYWSINGDIQNQIIRTDTLIRKYIKNKTTYFRSPYGKWSKEVAMNLNSNLFSTLEHIGPIHWDMGGMDCYFWRLGRSVDEAVNAYLEDISKVRKGIILFHDDIADMDFVKPQNKTLELLKSLIPKLKASGYKFIALDEIASIREAANREYPIYLMARKKKVVWIADSSDTVYVSPKKQLSSSFTLEMLPSGKVAIQSAEKFYLSVDENNGNQIVVNKKTLDATGVFDFIPVLNNEFILRATNGNYLTIDDKSRLIASAPYMRLSEIFAFHSSLKLLSNTSPTFATTISLIKKRLLYIKSKIINN